MKIGIVGAGVVGQATARTWLEHCDEVRCWDAVKERRTHPLDSVLECDLVFICLPEAKVEGFIYNAVPPACRGLNFVLRSTVPVGTTRRLAEQYQLPNLVHSPEFLTERCAHTDAQLPTRNIVGVPDYDPDGTTVAGGNKAVKLLWVCYRDRFPGVPTYTVSSDESEATKLFQNGWFALKVAAFNELRSFADRKGLDWGRVLEALLADGRIGSSHTRVPGPDGKRGFGGKCLPKDLRQLVDCFLAEGLRPFVLEAALHRNMSVDRPEG